MMARKKTASDSTNQEVTPHRKQVQPRTENQALYMQTIENNFITLCEGPAGSGKDWCAVGKAVQYKFEGKIDKILICRPAVEAGERIGFLSGDFEEKLSPYVQHLYEILYKQVGQTTVIGWEKAKQLEICPLGLVRGRTFENCFIILSEAQNATLEQLKMFLTRIGQNCKMLINGDASQSDLGKRQQGGFEYCIERLTNLHGVGICKLEEKDIQRHSLIGPILERLKPHERE